ncbi:MAG: succinate dehydrogenase, cytochrome b556 subunit [Betaproteobacteria bacterium]|nr:succinate dehydrogenase, cytochrome b556 subunit [Betaproteobacteria bacterium]
MTSANTRPRPKHLNLFQIRLPIPGIISIMHRISGFGLFIMLPVLLYLLQQSLGSSESHAGLVEVLGNPLVKLVLLAVLWAFLHHFCAGIRYLVLDMHIGTSLQSARTSSFVVLGVSLALTVILGGWLW